MTSTSRNTRTAATPPKIAPPPSPAPRSNQTPDAPPQQASSIACHQSASPPAPRLSIWAPIGTTLAPLGPIKRSLFTQMHRLCCSTAAPSPPPTPIATPRHLPPTPIDNNDSPRHSTSPALAPRSPAHDKNWVIPKLLPLHRPGSRSPRGTY